jgi:hypothetical protein
MTTESKPKPSDVKRSRQYWTYDLRGATSIKAERNLSQLAEWDDRLNPAARKVLDFLIDWENDHHGDSLASLRHIAAHLNARAPDGCKIAKRTVEDGIACLLASGWVVRTRKGTGQKNASRYVIPVDILNNAGLGHLPTVRDTTDGSTVRDVTDSTVLQVADSSDLTVRNAADEDTLTSDALKDARTDVVICIPQATHAAEGGGLAGFDLLAATYDKPGDDLVKARIVYDRINPDEAKLARMVRAAASWRRTAKGARMSLANWLAFKPCPWLTIEQDNQPSSRYPSCVVTWIKPIAAGGARLKYRDEHGESRARVLDPDELENFIDACASDRPYVKHASEDLHELFGAQFHIDVDGCFGGIIRDAA